MAKVSEEEEEKCRALVFVDLRVYQCFCKVVLTEGLHLSSYKRELFLCYSLLSHIVFDSIVSRI